MEEPEIAVVGTKGQIVIPLQLRRQLRIKPKTKLAFYRRGDKLVLAKLMIPPLKERLEALFNEIDSQYKGREKATEKEILKEIQAYRQDRHKAHGA
jgi:AbrB family looped-hinge helix DNA binding protein